MTDEENSPLLSPREQGQSRKDSGRVAKTEPGSAEEAGQAKTEDACRRE
jgi:hypothetical protein